ncbi:6-phosphogluconolactonase [Chitinophaga dinghuensis]|uniref:6-phosphogluconolactonase n=1 Tax=Chitinophaga dinghuensis TaxID=1539050 RepID=A0A327VY97_9BACT|nr:lactonase family protein [Chitinophaga dinghuensis]RAJ81939.1 6-phosphogluconolactonase [Chitinophaga dinghuensis]
MKRIISSTLTLAALILLPVASILAQHPYLLIGTYTNNGMSKGIHVYSFDSNTGKMKPVSQVKTTNPSYLAVAADQQHVYAVNENDGPGDVSSFKFDSTSGELSLIAEVPSGGEYPCYVSISKNGKFIAVANYGTGNAVVYPITADGDIDIPVQEVHHEGTGPNKARQEKAHAHAAVFSPDGNYLMINDLGIDKIMVYKFNSETGALSLGNPAFVPVKPGSGPRHLTFDASGNYAYLITELTGEVIVYNFANGWFHTVQSISTHPKNYKGAIGSADIHISPDGKFLYASNRGDANSLAIFKRNRHNGKLKLVGFQSTLGVMPRNFNFDPSGNFLLVANQASNNVVVFKVNKKKGLLTPTGDSITVGSPVCIQWIK